MSNVLDLTGGDLDVKVIKGVQAQFKLGLYNPTTDALVPLVGTSTFTGNIAPANGGAVVTQWSVTHNAGELTVSISAANSNLLTSIGTRTYAFQLVQVDGSNKYPLCNGFITVEALL